MIKLFEDWLNEEIQNDAVDKVIAQFESWAKSLNLNYGVDKYYNSVVCHVKLMGYWTLEYEKSKTKGKQDSMYRQTYNTGDTHKWYIKYPARFSQYSPRANVKSGNLKTFKSLIERFMKTKEKFDMVHEFLRLLDSEKFKSYNVNYSGKNLKDLEAAFDLPGGTIYDRPSSFSQSSDNLWRARYRALDRNANPHNSQIALDNFDPETGYLFYYAKISIKFFLK